MRQIDWNKPLSEDDKAWLRQAGLWNIEDRISANERQFKEPESDEDGPEDEELDDYDERSKAELQAEIAKRTPKPEVKGSGKDGAVLKDDLILALRVWDEQYAD